jgi:hypothetical protein
VAVVLQSVENKKEMHCSTKRSKQTKAKKRGREVILL